MEELEELLLPIQAAQMVQMKKDTLAKWRHQRRGPKFVVLGNNSIRYRKADVLAFIKSRIASGTDRPDPEVVRRASPRRQRPEDEARVRQPKRRKGGAK